MIVVVNVKLNEVYLWLEYLFKINVSGASFDVILGRLLSKI